MKNGTDSVRPSMKSLGTLAGVIVEFLSTIFNSTQVDYWLEHKTELKKKLREVFSLIDEFIAVREDWQKFYKGFLNWDVDFSRVLIPQMPTEGKWRLIFVAKGLTCNKVYNAWSFRKGKYYDDLDANTPKNSRTASESYAKWVRDGVEPDEEFLGQSTNQADPKMEIGITLLERMIFEAKFFSETGKHLDVKGVTFCSGSRCSDGNVPDVSLGNDGWVYVDWGRLSYSDPVCGFRRVV